MSRIAVGVDFSPDSQRAIAHAVMLARRVGASVTLIHAAGIPPPMGVAAGDPWLALLRERLAAERAQLDELRLRFSGQGVELSQVFIEGTPDTALSDAAAGVHADLIVVGTHGRTGLRRLTMGSVAEKTVRLASSSVLVVRGDAPAAGYQRIVVGLDYSELSWRALERAFELAPTGAEVRAIHTWQLPYVEYDVGGRMIRAVQDSETAAAVEHRQRVIAMAPDGVEASLSVELGVPFTVLDAQNVDLVVVGTHGRRGIRRFFLGSVAEATVRHARSSVLVVR